MCILNKITSYGLALRTDQVWDKIAPGLASDFDSPYTIPAIAPRPLLILNGKILSCPSTMRMYSTHKHIYKYIGALIFKQIWFGLSFKRSISLK